MISETILDKLKPTSSLIIKPNEKTLTKLIKTQNSFRKSQNELKRELEIAKFQETLLSINSSQKTEFLTSREPKPGKRLLLKSLKGGPLIPIVKHGNTRQITPPLISQSLPSLKPKADGIQLSQSNHQKKKSNSLSKQQKSNDIQDIQSQSCIQKTFQSQQDNNTITQQQQTITSEKNGSINQQNQETLQIKTQPELIEEQQDGVQSQMMSEQEHIECLVEQHLSEHEGFVQHLTGKCICVQCPCGRCKCKYSYKPYQTNIGWNSNYRTSYKENPIKEQDLKVDLEQFKKFKSVEPCEYKTIMTTDFKPYEVHAPQPKQQKLYQPTIGDTPQTSYKNFYMNYGDLHYEQFKQSHYQTVIPELPFNPSTTYKQCFKVKEIQENTIAKPPNGKPFPTIDLFLGASQNKEAYQPKLIEKVKVNDQRNALNQVPAYQGQFTSVSHSDFVKKEIPCTRYKGLQ